ncbi:MAG: hypothetical protein A2015_02560 [Spirochaetes bacterium GWF1_31_7]|nr:MAG: hypothetical protein A2Y30_16065 [Spirochaetes bacterium GWE1_32_154]OHD53186.1 MAG: hypothetical protein A2015_02560 [Spirochaetes bacterium GWF1_31_7]OHD78369.1 MAG: hypothetical protein A2355_01815 [Spirochaetes bacterium RIFOXYB1_FULL_32_8]HBD94997.1 hypothetical protein [Spirochaetia bacterium]HBI37357.1 hypothetical protein [Spirochaetia bacterium]
MKINFILFATAFTICNLFPETRVVVLNFNNVNIDKTVAEAATEILSTTIAQEKIFQVIERNQLDKIFNELKLNSNDEFNENQAIEIGKLAKANSIIIGSLTKIGDTISVNARLIDVATGSIILAKRVSTDNINSLDSQIVNLAMSFNTNSKIKENTVIENIILNKDYGKHIKSFEIEFKNTRISVRPRKHFNTFKSINLLASLNDIEIKYVLIEFDDKTKFEIFQPFKIQNGHNHIISFSNEQKKLKKIKLIAKIDRSITKSWIKPHLTISGKN